MPLIQLVVTLIVVGVLLWAMNTYIPMDPKIRQYYQHRGGRGRGALAVAGVRRA